MHRNNDINSRKSKKIISKLMKGEENDGERHMWQLRTVCVSVCHWSDRLKVNTNQDGGQGRNFTYALK